MSRFFRLGLGGGHARNGGFVTAPDRGGAIVGDPERQRAIYAELDRYALEQVPTAGLAWRDQGYAMTRDLRGFANMPGALTFYSASTLETAEFA